MRTDRKNPEMPVVTLSGELDLYTKECLAQELDDLLEDKSQSKVGLDLGEVQFVDSSALSVIQEASQKMASRGRELVLQSASRPVLRAVSLLTAAGLLSLSLGGFTADQAPNSSQSVSVQTKSVQNKTA